MPAQISAENDIAVKIVGKVRLCRRFRSINGTKIEWKGKHGMLLMTREWADLADFGGKIKFLPSKWAKISSWDTLEKLKWAELKSAKIPEGLVSKSRFSDRFCAKNAEKRCWPITNRDFPEKGCLIVKI